MSKFEPVPPPSPGFAGWFARYAVRRIRRSFHRLRLLGREEDVMTRVGNSPLVVYANHCGWWDPMVGLAIGPVCFPGRTAYTPIDAEMLERYGVFKKLGFFGVDRSSVRGVKTFLLQAEEVLHRPGSMLFVTPQGRFADVRERPVRFQPGVAHLAGRAEGICFVPMVMEYVFWEESKPEILLHFGSVTRFPPGTNRDEVLRTLEAAMEEAQDELARAAVARDGGAFSPLLQGSAGAGPVYDGWRRLRGWLRGRKTALHHSDL